MKQILRLRAEDVEDLRVVSAVLQDALVSVGEMEFVAGEHRFAMVVNRFRWENCSETADMPVLAEPEARGDQQEDAAFAECESYERVNCGICFEGVAQVRCKGVDRRERGRILELLAVQAEPGAVILVFAGGAALRLEGTAITCQVEDLGEPWPTRWRPHHPLSDTA